MQARKVTQMAATAVNRSVSSAMSGSAHSDVATASADGGPGRSVFPSVGGHPAPVPAPATSVPAHQPVVRVPAGSYLYGKNAYRPLASGAVNFPSGAPSGFPAPPPASARDSAIKQSVASAERPERSPSPSGWETPLDLAAFNTPAPAPAPGAALAAVATIAVASRCPAAAAMLRRTAPALAPAPVAPRTPAQSGWERPYNPEGEDEDARGAASGWELPFDADALGPQAPVPAAAAQPSASTGSPRNNNGPAPVSAIFGPPRARTVATVGAPTPVGSRGGVAVSSSTVANNSDATGSRDATGSSGGSGSGWELPFDSAATYDAAMPSARRAITTVPVRAPLRSPVRSPVHTPALRTQPQAVASSLAHSTPARAYATDLSPSTPVADAADAAASRGAGSGWEDPVDLAVLRAPAPVPASALASPARTAAASSAFPALAGFVVGSPARSLATAAKRAAKTPASAAKTPASAAKTPKGKSAAVKSSPANASASAANGGDVGAAPLLPARTPLPPPPALPSHPFPFLAPSVFAAAADAAHAAALDEAQTEAEVGSGNGAGTATESEAAGLATPPQFVRLPSGRTAVLRDRAACVALFPPLHAAVEGYLAAHAGAAAADGDGDAGPADASAAAGAAAPALAPVLARYPRYVRPSVVFTSPSRLCAFAASPWGEHMKMCATVDARVHSAVSPAAPAMTLAMQRGLLHEAHVLDGLVRSCTCLRNNASASSAACDCGGCVLDLTLAAAPRAERLRRTLTAVAAGVAVIYQGSVEADIWTRATGGCDFAPPSSPAPATAAGSAAAAGGGGAAVTEPRTGLPQESAPAKLIKQANTMVTAAAAAADVSVSSAEGSEFELGAVESVRCYGIFDFLVRVPCDCAATTQSGNAKSSTNNKTNPEDDATASSHSHGHHANGPCPHCGTIVYDVWDAKLSSEVKPAAMLQIALYALMLRAQLPPTVRFRDGVVALGSGRLHRFPLAHALGCARLLAASYGEFAASFHPERAPPALPTSAADHASYAALAAWVLARRDCVSAVAGVTARHATKLAAAGIPTAARLARLGVLFNAARVVYLPRAALDVLGVDCAAFPPLPRAAAVPGYVAVRLGWAARLMTRCLATEPHALSSLSSMPEKHDDDHNDDVSAVTETEDEPEHWTRRFLAAVGLAPAPDRDAAFGDDRQFDDEEDGDDGSALFADSAGSGFVAGLPAATLQPLALQAALQQLSRDVATAARARLRAALLLLAAGPRAAAAAITVTAKSDDKSAVETPVHVTAAQARATLRSLSAARCYPELAAAGGQGAATDDSAGGAEAGEEVLGGFAVLPHAGRGAPASSSSDDTTPETADSTGAVGSVGDVYFDMEGFTLYNPAFDDLAQAEAAGRAAAAAAATCRGRDDATATAPGAVQWGSAESRTQHLDYMIGAVVEGAVSSLPAAARPPAAAQEALSSESQGATEDALTFVDWWAHSLPQEGVMFAAVLRFLTAVASATDNGDASAAAHGTEGAQGAEGAAPPLPPRVYHYAPYELTALRRMARRHSATLGPEVTVAVERLIARGLFVDVYPLVTRAIAVGEPRYSLKNVEKVLRAGHAPSLAQWADTTLTVNARVDAATCSASATGSAAAQGALVTVSGAGRGGDVANAEDSIRAYADWLADYIARLRSGDPDPDNTHCSSNSNSSIGATAALFGNKSSPLASPEECAGEVVAAAHDVAATVTVSGSGALGRAVPWARHSALVDIRAYNRDDCANLRDVTLWLRAVRDSSVAALTAARDSVSVSTPAGTPAKGRVGTGAISTPSKRIDEAVTLSRALARLQPAVAAAAAPAADTDPEAAT